MIWDPLPEAWGNRDVVHQWIEVLAATRNGEDCSESDADNMVGEPGTVEPPWPLTCARAL